jgi:SAM-dependent methyltransferase
MLMPGLKQVAYDPSRYDIETVDEAVNIILCPTEGMTANQRWADEAPALMRIIERHVEPESMVLDYGCGIGRLAKPLIEKLGCVVVGIDISSNMRALAASLVDSPKFCAMDPAMFDAVFLEFETPVRFDAVVAVWVLQHCLDLGDAISRIRSSMKPGGKLIVVNNKTRCVPVENGEWADDGLDLDDFSAVEIGSLDESVAPGWMQDGTFWAVYEKV